MIPSAYMRDRRGGPDMGSLLVRSKSIPGNLSRNIELL